MAVLIAEGIMYCTRRIALPPSKSAFCRTLIPCNNDLHVSQWCLSTRKCAKHNKEPNNMQKLKNLKSLGKDNVFSWHLKVLTESTQRSGDGYTSSNTWHSIQRISVFTKTKPMPCRWQALSCFDCGIQRFWHFEICKCIRYFCIHNSQ